MPRVDPYKNYRFLVELDGIVQAGFSECSGFG
ncbi:MAG: phage tail protein, partial [Moorea sp. SIO4G2]|nr:phage tail protein [Moorena sp. SIO4G2]